MGERFFDRLLGRIRKQQPPNCYGFALSQFDGRLDNFRDPKSIWKDCEFIGILQENRRSFRDIPYARTDIPIVCASQAELIAILDVDGYIGGSEVVHVIANKLDTNGKVHNRPGCYEPVEAVYLNELLDHYTERGNIAVGFINKKGRR